MIERAKERCSWCQTLGDHDRESALERKKKRLRGGGGRRGDMDGREEKSRESRGIRGKKKVGNAGREREKEWGTPGGGELWRG